MVQEQSWTIRMQVDGVMVFCSVFHCFEIGSHFIIWVRLASNCPPSYLSLSKAGVAGVQCTPVFKQYSHYTYGAKQDMDLNMLCRIYICTSIPHWGEARLW